MTNYRRYKYEGGYYFFTVVTYNRRYILTSDLGRRCFRSAWMKIREQRPFQMIAFCLLPDHLHCIWNLPDGDNDYSLRWSLIKRDFTRRYLLSGGTECKQDHSRKNKRERGIWQRRFWEHRIRNEHDLQKHIDYIHFNPVKHGLVEQAEQWPWSTYHRYDRTNLHNYIEQHGQSTQRLAAELPILHKMYE